MHPSALLHPLRTTRSVAGTITRPLSGLLEPSSGAVSLDLTSEDAEYLRQLAPGITTALPTGASTETARLRAERARRAAATYLDARRSELRAELDGG